MHEMKLCECGCGQQADIATYTNARRGHVKGMPLRLAAGHRLKGSLSGRWKGGRLVKTNGYVCVLATNHPRADSKGYIYEHYLIAERALGRPLPEKSEIHHFNEVKSDNRNANLVICESHAYHVLLHERALAIRATGSPTARQCWVCKLWEMDNLECLGSGSAHASCMRDYHRTRASIITGSVLVMK